MHFLPEYNSPKFIFFILLAGMFFLFGCNSTKYVPEGKYMLNKVEIQVDNNTIPKEDLKAHIKQKSNLRILGFIKFHLGLYNLSSPKHENGWFKRIGEAPVIYEEYQARQSIDQMNVYLRNKGYYNAIISDTIIYNPRKPKVDQTFRIKPGKPYTIRNLDYDISDKDVKKLVLADSVKQLIKVNHLFDVDILNAERNRITRMLRNKGYYQFSEDYISYLADSSFYNKQVDLTLKIEDANPETTTFEPHRKFKVGKYIVNSEFIPTHVQAKTIGTPDTIYEGNYAFLYKKKPNYKPVLFKNLNRIPDSTYFCLENVEKTYRALNRLRQFKMININFSEVDSMSSSKESMLNCNFQLSPLPRQNVSVEVEGTNSSGNFGVAGNLNVQHRNIFRGAEVLDFKVRGAVERQQKVGGSKSLDFNTRELGLESTITFPKFLSPLKRNRPFGFQIPQTELSIGYNYQHRPDYTRTISNFRFGYNWKSSALITQTFNVLDFNYVKLSAFDEDFIQSLEDYYIKTSFTDHLISATNYTWTYNNQNLNRAGDYRFLKVSLESAGNLLDLYSLLIDKSKSTEVDTTTNEPFSYYQVLNTRFAQYLKADLEYRYNYRFDEYNTIVTRAFLGIGLPFGNFDVLPFEKKYFAGGANGIRAWQVRSLGPGSYAAPSSSYPNQLSDIKLEGNAEYRFQLVPVVEGALFIDAGNIWAINSKDTREGAVFKFNNFYNQIAVGTGLGLRFDFDYFLFRLDLGMKLRDPSLEEGRRWIPGSHKITGDTFNLSFAIGYPF